MDSQKYSREQSPFLNGGDAASDSLVAPFENQSKVNLFALSTTESDRRDQPLKIDHENAEEQKQDHAKKGCRNYLGILLALFAGFIFTVGNIFVKYMKNYHAFTLAMYRTQGTFVPSIFIVLYVVKVQKIKVFQPIWPLFGEKRKWTTVLRILLRATLGFTALFLHFFALKYLTVADVAVFGSCKPIFVTILSFLVLNEACGVVSVLVALLTMVGVVVITRPPILTGEDAFDTATLVGAAFALGSVLTDTCVVIIVRSLRHIHVSVMMLFLGCWGTVQSVFCAYMIGELKLPESDQDWGFALGLSSVALLNQAAMNMALQYEQANPVAVTRTMDFIFAFALQFAILGVVPDLFSLSGATIIIMCVLLIAFRKWLNSLSDTHVARKRYWFVLI